MEGLGGGSVVGLRLAWRMERVLSSRNVRGKREERIARMRKENQDTS